MKFSIIAAISRNKVLGKDNKIPWSLPEDMKRYVAFTTGNPPSDKKNALLMGRKTWESIPEKYRPLKNRINVVITRQPDYSVPEGVLVYSSLDQALTELKNNPEVNNVLVNGGQEVYAQAIIRPECSTLYLTEIDQDFEGDSFFPEIPKDFKLIEESEYQTSESGLRYRFLMYSRV